MSKTFLFVNGHTFRIVAIVSCDPKQSESFKLERNKIALFYNKSQFCTNNKVKLTAAIWLNGHCDNPLNKAVKKTVNQSGFILSTACSPSLK